MTHRAIAQGLDRRALVVANQPEGRRKEALDAALDVLREHHFSCTQTAPSDPQSLLEVLRNGRANHDVVVLAGGDGTMNLAIPALRGEGAPLGILPMGTANDLARTLGLSLDPAEAATTIATGKVANIDIGRVNGKYFFNVAHIGAGASARRYVTPERKHRWKVLAYPISLLHALHTDRPFRVTIQVDGYNRQLRAVHVAVGNGHFFGGGVPIAEDANISDQQLDISCIRAGGVVALFRALGAMLLGKPGPDSVWRARGRHVELHTGKPRTIIADGEELSHTPGIFDVEARAVPVIVPDDHPDGDSDVSG